MRRPYARAVPYMNCQIPTAPARDTARGFSADSITARYFNSYGTPYRSNTCSNIGK